jgi:P27 family predicted phage terminase small subunit
MRLDHPVDPPADMDRATQAEWRIHMQLVLGAGVMSVIDLRAFRSLCEAAALSARCYREAMKAGPVTTNTKGDLKLSPELLAWKLAAGVYTTLLREFGLSPASARTLPQLPPAQGGSLSVVA